MLQGQQRAPVRTRDRREDQEPSPIGLPEQLLPGALLHGALRPGALLPAARWVCRPIGSFPRDAGLACRGAREFTGQTLRGWGLPVLAEDATVIVSELVTNALRYALPEPVATGPPGQIRLGLLDYGPWFLCAVADPGQATPVPRSCGSLAETGRGLQLICALSDLWGYTEPTDTGKIVWAMFTARHAARSRARLRPGSSGA